jgi:MFS family permease
MAFLTGSLNFVGGWTLIVIVLARQQGASASLTGTIFAVSGVVGLLGAAIALRIQRRFSFGQAIIGVVWCAVLLYVLLAVAATPALLIVSMVYIGLVGPTYDTVQFSYRLAVIPDALQGRVNSAFRLVALGMQPLGLALTGVLLELFGGSVTALILAGVHVAVALVTTLNRNVRHAPPITEARTTA